MGFYPPGTTSHEKELMNILVMAAAIVMLVAVSAFAIPFLEASLLVLAWAILMVFVILMGMEILVFKILVRKKEEG